MLVTQPLPAVFTVDSSNFEQIALQVYNYQYTHVPVYNEFCTHLGRTPDTVTRIEEIPFMPVELFKTHRVIATGQPLSNIFESSGTTGSVSSKHFVGDPALYEQSFLTAFQKFYGKPEDYVILAMLPSYLERSNSSLVYMADKLIKLSNQRESGFFMHLTEKLIIILNDLRMRKQKTILIGVTFALLDFAEQFRINFPDLIVMETGGMKGRREEMTRKEVHDKLTKAFGVPTIHSEYGMTELLSQGYSYGNGVFKSPPWMKIIARDMYDPMRHLPPNQTGAVNVIDLANLHSCSFIATGDIGKVSDDGSFEILGRMDNTELRGCNLMYV